MQVKGGGKNMVELPCQSQTRLIGDGARQEKIYHCLDNGSCGLNRMQLINKIVENHCTIGYAMKIKKKKMFKSKHLVFAHFSTKTGDFFGIDGKIPMFCHKYFLKSKM